MGFSPDTESYLSVSISVASLTIGDMRYLNLVYSEQSILSVTIYLVISYKIVVTFIPHFKKHLLNTHYILGNGLTTVTKNTPVLLELAF